MNDNQLIKISSDIDDFLMKLAFENEVTALSLTAIVLARLAIMCDDMECREDMNNLMAFVSKASPSDSATIQ
jgi:hypothetical protein